VVVKAAWRCVAGGRPSEKGCGLAWTPKGGRAEREGRAGEREGIDKDKDTASIKNLDNNALNLYTAGRAYGWLNEAARPAGAPREDGNPGSSVPGRKMKS